MARGRHPTRIYIDPPDQQVAEKYLRSWYGGDIIHEPDRFPSLTSFDLFDNHKPLEIDFGCGMGILTCNRAKQNPDCNIIGIDISQKPIFCAIDEAHTLGLDNIKFVRSNFNAIMPLLKPLSVKTAYYLFPNPPGNYYRQRSNEGRKKFLETIYKSLVIGGQFIFATDSDAFFNCMQMIIATELHYVNSILDFESSGLVTWYREIWESRGKMISGLVVRKITE